MSVRYRVTAAPQASGYSEAGASYKRRALRAFFPNSNSPSSDIHDNADILRQRSRMLYMSAPVATSAINTNRTKIVGTGLTLKATVDRNVLGLSPEKAKEWQSKTEAEFRLWAENRRSCDAMGLNDFYGLQQLALKSWLMSGDVFAVVKIRDPDKLHPYGLRLHLVEADRVSTPDKLGGMLDGLGYTEGTNPNTGNKIYDGVEVDSSGMIVAYHVRNTYPHATMYDELELDKLGDRKTALFLIMSDTDSTFNFLISMIYSQLFNLLCDKADDVYGGKLPVHVRCLIDECANIGQIPQLEKLVATIRSREISACLVLQTRSQLKAIYKDNADTIVGNMDSQIFLGGSEPTTLKELSEALGKETIDGFNTSDTRGNSPSYGTNYQKLGHELMSRDELAVLDGGKCILQLRGVRPFLSDKYDLTQHPNYKMTSDADPKNALDIEKYLSHKEKIRPDDQFVLVDVDSLPPA